MDGSLDGPARWRGECWRTGELKEGWRLLWRVVRGLAPSKEDWGECGGWGGERHMSTALASANGLSLLTAWCWFTVTHTHTHTHVYHLVVYKISSLPCGDRLFAPPRMASPDETVGPHNVSKTCEPADHCSSPAPSAPKGPTRPDNEVTMSLP